MKYQLQAAVVNTGLFIKEHGMKISLEKSAAFLLIQETFLNFNIASILPFSWD